MLSADPDSLISIKQILKGKGVSPVVRVRSFIGETEKVRWVNERQPSFIKNQAYLFFLEKDTGATAKVDPGDYVSVNANMAVYVIIDGKAKSADDEWVLEDLIAYIQKSLNTEPPLPADTPAEVPISTETASPIP